MAYCPNCNVEVRETAAYCANCDATFGDNAAWKPVAAPGGPVKQRQVPQLPPEVDPFAGHSMAPLASPWTLVGNAFVLSVASVFMSGGWSLLGFFFAPYIAIPVAAAFAVIPYLLFEIVGGLLKRFLKIDFVNFFVCLALVGLVSGFLPVRLYEGGDGGRAMLDKLLEDFAEASAFYSALLYIMGAIWWGSYASRRNPEE